MSARVIGLAIALGVAVAFAGTAAALAAARPAATDAIALYAGARLVATGAGASLVDDDAVLRAERAASPDRTALLPYVQPPLVALVLAPFGLLPFGIAYPLMAALEGIVLVAAIALLVPAATPSRPLVVALALAVPPSAVAIVEAQTSPLVLLLVAIAARAGPRAGGLALGATLLRPQAAPLLLLVGLLDPARRAWTALGAAAIVAASVGVVGLEGIARYSASLVRAASWSASGEFGLRTSVGWAGPAVALGLGELGTALSVISLAVGAVAVARTAPQRRVAAASAWSLLASPHALLHDAVLALPALVRDGAASAIAATVGWTLHAAVAPVGILVSLGAALRALRAEGDRLGRP